MNNKKKLVYVGVSGGVDSSVSAALLKEKGYDVVGVFIKVWYPPFLKCNWKDEKRDAMRVCAKLNIPFLLFDAEKEYKRDVVDYMISSYKTGITPNPDVMCNTQIKFGVFYNYAMKKGADFVATGHYARIIKNKSGLHLYAGTDANKDQSYFLWSVNKSQLAKIIFPIGHLKKDEVRKLALKYNLHTATKKDSQGVCFMGKIKLEEFLGKFTKQSNGAVLDVTGKKIGSHKGSIFYTIGQRHGFTIDVKKTDLPYYVISKNIKRNTITVSTNSNNEKLEHKKIIISNINLFSSGKIPKECEVKYRYRQQPESCRIIRKNKNIEIIFKKPQKYISLGQSAVVYKNEECLAGGIITQVI